MVFGIRIAGWLVANKDPVCKPIFSQSTVIDNSCKVSVLQPGSEKDTKTFGIFHTISGEIEGICTAQEQFYRSLKGWFGSALDRCRLMTAQ